MSKNKAACILCKPLYFLHTFVLHVFSEILQYLFPVGLSGVCQWKFFHEYYVFRTVYTIEITL